MVTRQRFQNRSGMPSTVIAAAAVCIGVAAGCSNSPTAPSPLPPGTSHAAKSVSAVTITGPDTIAPGGQGQYRAIARYANGPEDVTTGAAWSSSKPEILEIGATGAARGRQRGLANLMVTFLGATQTFAVRVLEPGTFWLSGTIAGSEGQPLAGATIVVESGTGMGLTATTDAQGEFDLCGLAGTVQLKVSAPGYQGRSVSLSVTRDGTTHVLLAPVTGGGEPSILTITGPDRIFGTTQYGATLDYSDGRRQDVTNLATWSASIVVGHPLLIDNRGLVRITGDGRSEVRAVLGGLDHKIKVTAGPGWVVWGGIIDAETGQWLSGEGWLPELVIVVSGRAWGVWDDVIGLYQLWGAEGPVRLQVSFPGYVTRIVDLNVTGDANHNVALTPAR